MINTSLFYLNLGKVIKKIRGDNCTLDQFSSATGLGLSKSSLSEIEHGKQKILPHQLYQISETLNLSVDQLLEDAAEMSENSGESLDAKLGQDDKNKIDQL